MIGSPATWKGERGAAFLPESLAGQMAVVTGASSGVGRAVARELAARGAALCLIGRDRGKLEAGLGSAAPALTYKVDLAIRSEIDAFALAFERECGRADLLVHGAGVIAFGPVESAPIEDFDRQLDINLRAPYLLTQRLLPMLGKRPGQIVFINSSAGRRAVARSGQYSASKHALCGIANALREEVRSAGVRVINVFLGRTATPMQAAVHAHEKRPYCPAKLMQPEHVAWLLANALSLPLTVEIPEIHMRSFAC
ncbi:MAG TPA: SDR family NAD(P)-dependent oxidoreductase [Candidatus Eisenbacteria bacterium]|nr:SDR family NAD(P)-dependent oxidoreductase [Candidatus Eisenbacteria bacterium]